MEVEGNKDIFKKVILIGSIPNHHKFYLGLIKFLISIFNSITFLTSPVILNEIGEDIDENKVNVYSEKLKINKLLKKNKKFIRKFDILILDEYFGGFIKTFNIRFKNPVKIGIIHNVNKFFLMKNKLYYIFDIFFKNRFFKQFDSYLVESPIVKKYLEELVKNKHVFFFPGEENYKNEIIPSKKEILAKQDLIQIAIPGMITEERREYIKLLTILKKFYSNFPNSRIRIKFLGSIKNEKNIEKKKIILDFINEINLISKDAIFYGKEYIPTNEFFQIIEKTDLILSNSKVFYSPKDRVEIYGITKITGISYLLYKYDKPAIIPYHQNILMGFDSQLIKFKEYGDLMQIFNSIENDEIDLKTMKSNAFKNRIAFNKLIDREKKSIKNYLKSNFD